MTLFRNNFSTTLTCSERHPSIIDLCFPSRRRACCCFPPGGQEQFLLMLDFKPASVCRVTQNMARPIEHFPWTLIHPRTTWCLPHPISCCCVLLRLYFLLWTMFMVFLGLMFVMVGSVFLAKICVVTTTQCRWFTPKAQLAPQEITAYSRRTV